MVKTQLVTVVTSNISDILPPTELPDNLNSPRQLSNLITWTKTNQEPIAVQIQVHVTCYQGTSFKFNKASDGRTKLNRTFDCSLHFFKQEVKNSLCY